MRRVGDLLTLLALVLWVAPMGWQLVTSLTPNTELLDPAHWWPSRLTLVHYRAVLLSSPVPRALFNSAGTAVLATLLATALGTLGAYALGRLPVPGRRPLMIGIVLSTAFPAIATVAPLYLLLRAAGLRDTWTAIIVADTSFALPLVLWLVSGFMRALPRELEEAAMVDGASRLGALRYVILPAAAPGVAAAALVTFLFAWNEFLFAYTFTATDASRTVPVALALFPGVFEIPWGDIAAAALLAGFPPIAIVVGLQRYLVRGLLAGALTE